MATNLQAQFTEQLFIPQLTDQLNLSLEEQTYIDQVRNRVLVADVQLISLTDIFNLQENSYVRFLFLDQGVHNILVETIDIQYDAPDIYRYKGTVMENGLSIGELILNRSPAGYAGDFRFHENAYEIIHLNERLSILARKYVPEGYDLGICEMVGGQNATSSSSNDDDCFNTPSENIPVFCKDSSVPCYASSKVLILVTPEAKAYYGASNLELSLSTMIERTNYAMQVSEANTSLTYVYEDNFNWVKTSETSIKDDVDSLTNYSIAKNLRELHQADLVVMLTDAYDNTSTGGFGADFGPNCAKAYAIVVVEQTGFPVYVFPHEVGHLFGARHDDFDKDHGNTCAQAYNIANSSGTPIAKTVNHQSSNPYRILHYSNPDVYWNGYPTGVFFNNGNHQGTKDNAGRIKIVSCDIANFMDDADMVVNIEGDKTICNSTEQYDAIVVTSPYSPSQGPYTYAWGYSSNGIFDDATYFLETSATLTLSPQQFQHCETFFLHVIAYANNGVTGKYTKKIKRQAANCSLCSGGGNNFNQSNRNIFTSPKGQNHAIQLFPNPSNGQIILNWHLDQEEKVNINLFDSNGKVKLVKTLNLDKGINKLSLDLDLENGIYFLKATNSDEVYNKTIIIQK